MQKFKVMELKNMNMLDNYKNGNPNDLNEFLCTCTDSDSFVFLANAALENNEIFDALILLSHQSHNSFKHLFSLLSNNSVLYVIVNNHESYFQSSIIPTELKYVVYMSIVRSRFLGEINIEIDIVISIFKIMSDDFYQSFSKVAECYPIEKSKFSPDIWLITGQFLSLQHGPTLTVMTLANEIKNQGLSVGIISTNSFNFNRNIYSDSAFYGNFIPELSNSILIDIESMKVEGVTNKEYSVIKYKGKEYPYYSCDGSMLDKIINLKSVLNKGKIISIGDSNVYSDYLSRDRVIYNIPCSFSFPIVNNEYPAICRNIRDNESNIASKYKHGIVESRFPYSTRFKICDIHLEKKLETDKLLIALVGSRLIDELDEKTMTRMALINKSFINVEFLFIGIDEHQELSSRLNDYGIYNMSFIGFVKNPEQYLARADFYLNPNRLGGGTSVLESLYLSIPPICFPFGDGGYTAGEFFTFSDDYEVIHFIKNYFKSPNEAILSCKESYSINTDVKQVLCDITRIPKNV